MFKYSSWFVLPERRCEKRVELLCFPYAGGSPAAFRPWASSFQRSVEVLIAQLPGRDGRYSEPLLDNMDDIVNALYHEMRSGFEVPTFFYGHSLGGLIAYELCMRLLEKGGASGVSGLIVSGSSAPHLRMKRPWIHDLDTAEFKEKLKGYQGTPSEVLEHSELFELLEPRLRADFKAAETYVLPQLRQSNKVDCPILALGGLGDDHVGEVGIKAWERYTSRAFHCKFFSGDHFFIVEHQQNVIDEVTRFVNNNLGLD